MSGSFLDIANWSRREHYHFYRDYDQPFFNITAEVRATGSYQATRGVDGASFFLATLFHSLVAANAVREFRLRLRPNGVWCHDRIHAGSTIMRSDDTFGFAYFDMAATFAEFETRGKQILEKGKLPSRLEPRDDRDDLIHYSVLPWIRFTSFAHARKKNPHDSVPKIVFGRRFDRDGDVWLPVSVEVHHALVDGLYVARFLERFEQEMNPGS